MALRDTIGPPQDIPTCTGIFEPVNLSRPYLSIANPSRTIAQTGPGRPRNTVARACHSDPCPSGETGTRPAISRIRVWEDTSKAPSASPSRSRRRGI